MIKVVIIDDEPLSRDVVKAYLKRYSDFEIVNECNDGFEGLKSIQSYKPDLVFLDEPTSGLDPIGRRLVREIIEGLREQGTAVFLNSHLLSEIEQTCDRVAFIREGKVLQTSSLSEFEKERLRVFIRVGQPTEQLMTDLAQFGEEVKMERGNGRIQLLLPHDDHLPQLASWLIQQGHTLYELSPQRLSLEERFLQVVGNKSEE